MGNKRKKRNNRKRRRASPAAGKQAKLRTDLPTPDTPWDEVMAKFQALLATAPAKAAVDYAKAAHKAKPCDASKGLLREAYERRLRGLIARNMLMEAENLMAGVRPLVGELPAIERLLALRGGDLDSVVRPLADPSIAPAERRELEDLLRHHLLHPGQLADCASLASDHPLRVAAGAVRQALARATAGESDTAAVDLAGISRRSPLAPWKLLVRAIASLYRDDTSDCRAAIEALEHTAAGTPPTRLCRPLRQLLGDPVGPLPEPAQRLVAAVSGRPPGLVALLRQLDARLGKGKLPKAAQLRELKNQVERDAPHLSAILPREIYARLAIHQLKLPSTALGALGTVPLDAQTWLLLATGFERAKQNLHFERKGAAVCTAAFAWEAYRHHAVAEGQLAADGPQTAAVDLHLLDLVERLPPEALEEVRLGFAESGVVAGLYADQTEAIRVVGHRLRLRTSPFLNPDALLARACQTAPQAETFQRWLSLRRAQQAKWQALDSVAEQWAKHFPTDPRPWLALAQSAEQRNALKKALTFLDKAEALDQLNADVRRARVRLWVATALRHLAQHKTQLLRKDIDALAVLPQLQQGDREVLLAALRWCLAGMTNAAEGAAHFSEVSDRLGPVAAALVLHGLWLHANPRGCGVPPTLPTPPKTADPNLVELVEQMGRGLAFGDAMGLALPVAQFWQAMLHKRLGKRVVARKEPPGFDFGHAARVTEALLSSRLPKATMALTTLGLRHDPARRPRWLFLRCQALPNHLDWRPIQVCLAAAALAREARQMELLQRITDFMRQELCFRGELMPSDNAREIADRELELGPDEDYPSPALACDCPACRAEAGLFWDDDDDDFDEEGDWEDEADGPFDDLAFLVQNLSPAMARRLVALLLENGGVLPDPRQLQLQDPRLFAALDKAMEQQPIPY